jgi:hypothetical protein
VDGKAGQRSLAEQLHQFVIYSEEEIVFATNLRATREVEITGMGIELSSCDTKTLRIDGIREAKNPVERIECNHHIASNVKHVDPIPVVKGVDISLMQGDRI